jgi:hypothetical protein
MTPTLLAVALVAVLPAVAAAQYAPSAPPGGRDPQAIQHGAQPNPQEVRPGSPDGDAPSAAAGRLVRDPAGRRLLGLPVTLVLLLAGLLVALAVVGAFVVPGTRRRRQARGGGSYGR